MVSFLLNQSPYAPSIPHVSRQIDQEINKLFEDHVPLDLFKNAQLIPKRIVSKPVACAVLTITSGFVQLLELHEKMGTHLSDLSKLRSTQHKGFLELNVEMSVHTKRQHAQFISVAYLQKNIPIEDMVTLLSLNSLCMDVDQNLLFLRSEQLEPRLRVFQEYEKEFGKASVSQAYLQVLRWHHSAYKILEVSDVLMHWIIAHQGTCRTHLSSLSMRIAQYMSGFMKLETILKRYKICSVFEPSFYQNFCIRLRKHTGVDGVDLANLLKKTAQHVLETFFQGPDRMVLVKSLPLSLQQDLQKQWSAQEREYMEQVLHRMDEMFLEKASKKKKKERKRQPLPTPSLKKSQVDAKALCQEVQKIEKENTRETGVRVVGKELDAFSLANLPWDRVHARIVRYQQLRHTPRELWGARLETFMDKGQKRYEGCREEEQTFDALCHLFPLPLCLLYETELFTHKNGSFTALGRLELPGKQMTNYGIVEFGIGKKRVLVHRYFREFQGAVASAALFKTQCQFSDVCDEEEVSGLDTSEVQEQSIQVFFEKGYVKIMDVKMDLSLYLFHRPIH